MDFTLTDDQELLVRTARTLLVNECPSSLVRSAADDRSAVSPLWGHLREWVALGDGPLVDLCLFLEEVGAVLAPGPFLATAALFRPLVTAAAIQAGDGVAGTVALAGADGHWSPSRDAVRTFVLDADLAERVAVVLPGPRVAVTGPLPAREVATLDRSRPVFEVAVPEPEPDGSPLAPEDLEAVLARAWVSLAAEMVGAARWVLDATVEYAKQRVQFDRPIGSFQAVQHRLADMALALERARSAVYYAAMTIDADDPDRHRAAHVAKAAAGEAARTCAKGGIQLHGGIGYTWEHDLHLYLRRIFASEHLLGTTSWHHDRLADLLFA
jgi:hypothetical protein